MGITYGQFVNQTNGYYRILPDGTKVFVPNQKNNTGTVETVSPTPTSSSADMGYNKELYDKLVEAAINGQFTLDTFNANASMIDLTDAQKEYIRSVLNGARPTQTTTPVQTDNTSPQISTGAAAGAAPEGYGGYVAGDEETGKLYADAPIIGVPDVYVPESKTEDSLSANTPSVAEPPVAAPPSEAVLPTTSTPSENKPTITPTGNERVEIVTPPPASSAGTQVQNGTTAGGAHAAGTTGGATETVPTTPSTGEAAPSTPSTGEAAPSTPSTGDYYTNMMNLINDQHNSTLAAIQKMRDDNAAMLQTERDRVYKEAQVAKDRAVVDARTARKQASATYGNNAEALRRMGLTGSGYSEYIEGKAYAAERGDVQAANAQELLARSNADYSYLSGLQQSNANLDQLLAKAEQDYTGNVLSLEEQRKADEEKAAAADLAAKDKTASNYLSLMDAAKTGGYTADEIRAAAAVLGITDESQISAIVNAATTANTKKTEDEEKVAKEEADVAFNDALMNANGTLTPKDIEGMTSDPDQVKQLIAANDAAILSYIPASVQGVGAQNTFAEIDELKYKEQLSDDGYHNANFSVFLEIIDEGGSEYGGTTHIEQMVKDAEKAGKITSADAKSLIEYAKQKRVQTVSTNYGKAKKYNVLGSAYYIDSDANKMVLSLAENQIDENKEVLSTITPEEGQIAKVGDNYYIYIKKAGDYGWYKVNPHLNKKDDFDKFYAGLYAAGGNVARPKHATDED